MKLQAYIVKMNGQPQIGEIFSHRCDYVYKYPKDTNILYLGKSKQCLWGRLILHLGFHIDKHSQGLLLNEWAEKLNLKLKFNYCSFDSNMSELISFYEYKLAKNTKPLIGKHKL